MIAWIEKLFEGAKGRFIRVALATGAGVLASHYASNEWYISLTPFLSLVGKTLRDKYPGSWEWLPI